MIPMPNVNFLVPPFVSGFSDSADIGGRGFAGPCRAIGKNRQPQRGYPTPGAILSRDDAVVPLP